ncbi:hypothetical protein BC834DRAFT_885930 [Gloeopeniophorella convolvens]|nr:hypothetical protein BC834DRAFT_885930 [Gloeopeniophorella convolvens]
MRLVIMTLVMESVSDIVAWMVFRPCMVRRIAGIPFLYICGASSGFCVGISSSLRWLISDPAVQTPYSSISISLRNPIVLSSCPIAHDDLRFSDSGLCANATATAL